MAQLMNLIPAKLPEQSLAFTNNVYVSEADFAKLRTQTEGPTYVDINHCVFNLAVDARVLPGRMSFSDLQRKFARIPLPCSGRSEVSVRRFEVPAAFDLASCMLEVDFLQVSRGAALLEIKDSDLEALFRKSFAEQVLGLGQIFVVSYGGTVLKLTVTDAKPFDFGQNTPTSQSSAGMLSTQTELNFQQSRTATSNIQVLSTRSTRREIFHPSFNFEEIGIGGLSKEFADIFRRVFAARVCPPHVVAALGIKHVRGMLLHGPPGTGKTLIARQLAKFLNAAEPKIVNGPEVLSKWVGGSEKKIRELFEDAENDQKVHGNNSQLHVIILDEMDAICKERGSAKDGTGVSDNIVNQMLAKIDGVNGLNNILLIGMTNRRDLIDRGLLRPGRFELQVEISLPDQAGRTEILNIHTATMRENAMLDGGVSIQELAAQTRNFSGAELEGLVRAASACAMSRKVDLKSMENCSGFEDICVTMADFQDALMEVQPAFGQDSSTLGNCIEHGIIHFSEEFEEVFSKSINLIEQARNSDRACLLSALVVGPPGCGKSALSAELAQIANFPFARRIASEDYAGMSEDARIHKMTQVFDDAQKSPLSLVILDDLERLFDYTCIGPRFSNNMLQLIVSLLKRRSSKPGHRMVIVGTTSEADFARSSKLQRAFSITLNMPMLSQPEHFHTVLDGLAGVTTGLIDEVCAALRRREVGVRMLLQAIEMASQRHLAKQVDGSSSLTLSSEDVIECLKDAGAFDMDSSFCFVGP
jgi:vesicle-fusing ATPase